ncbi:XylR N-terminal domain-containing protein, partial [Enterobacter hormaechei]
MLQTACHQRSRSRLTRSGLGCLIGLHFCNLTDALRCRNLHFCRTEPMKQLPSYEDLTSRLRFSPELGRIWRDSERCVLLSNSALTSL